MKINHKLRIGCIFFIFFALFMVGIIHLFHLQIRQHSYFVDLGNKQYTITVTTPPARALILDRHGHPLALNHDSIAAFILPKTLKDPVKVKKFLQKQFPHVVQRLKKNTDNHFLYIKRKLTSQEQQSLVDSNLEDINFLNEPSRFYPSPATSAITGITNIDNNGLFGIELQFNTLLSGTPTTRALARDARSGHFYFSNTTLEQGNEGKPVRLTIDGDLQFLVQEELAARIEKFKAEEGAAIVMDPTTGEILAMASFPSFNANETREINIATTKNTAFTESYEFGSGIKAFAALAALEEEVVTPDEVIDCENTKTTYVEGRRINTVTAAGLLTFEEVIAQSNNIGIAKIAKRLGPKLYTHYKKLGFGSKTGIPLPGEQSGFVNPPERWSKQSIISLSYGYEISTTLLRMTNAFCVFSNGGRLITPRLVFEPEEYVKKSEKIYSDASIEKMRTILERTTSDKGTARHASLQGYTTLGKTSTANLLVNGHYVSEENMYGFFGSVEKGNYKRTIGCFIKKSPQRDLYAATVTAPLFKKIVEKLLIHEQVIAGENNVDSSHSTATQTGSVS